MFNSFDYCCGKETWNFPFQPFLNNILSGCPRSSHSHTRKQKAKQEAAIWKLNEIIPCRQYRTFHLTWKKCCWRVYPARKEKEKERNKKGPFFHHLGGFQWDKCQRGGSISLQGCVGHSPASQAGYITAAGCSGRPCHKGRCGCWNSHAVSLRKAGWGKQPTRRSRC